LDYFLAQVEVAHDLARAAEGRVEGTVGVETRQGKIQGPAGCVAARHDPAVALHDDGLGVVVGGGEIQGEHAATTEGCIEAAIRVVARRSEIEITRTIAGSRQNDFAVALKRNGIGVVDGGAREIRRYQPTLAKCGVETAVRVVARQGEVVAGATA